MFAVLSLYNAAKTPQMYCSLAAPLFGSRCVGMEQFHRPSLKGVASAWSSSFAPFWRALRQHGAQFLRLFWRALRQHGAVPSTLFEGRSVAMDQVQNDRPPTSEITFGFDQLCDEILPPRLFDEAIVREANCKIIPPISIISPGYVQDIAPRSIISPGYVKDYSFKIHYIARPRARYSSKIHVSPGYVKDIAPRFNISPGYVQDIVPISIISPGYVHDIDPRSIISTDYVHDIAI